MKRKDFLKKSTLGLGAIIAIPVITESCKKDDPNACEASPTETAGPFPIKTPADLVNENIIGDRTGIPLLINFTIQNVNTDCGPLEGVHVDVWQCDAKGNYSEYSGQLDGDFTDQHFLRGRQTANSAGQVSFISLYPGWYPGRAAHLHVEVKTAAGSSLLVTQVAFPDDISQTVYTSPGYKGEADTTNTDDGAFKNDLAFNIADAVTGNLADGYTLTKIIKVNA